MASALSLNSYLLSIFAPYMLDEFGWSRSQWAMLGLVQLLVSIGIPIAGRLTDLYGVRKVAAIGAFTYPVFLLMIAGMNGDIRVYLAIYVAQTLICSTTTSTVYSRVVAAAFKVHRGLALGVAGSAPPLMGAALSPLMSGFVADHGWRAGYVTVAIICAIGAVVTFVLLKSGDSPAYAEAGPAAEKRSSRDYRTILKSPVFWIMAAALFLANLPFSLATSQLKMVVLDQGLSDAIAASMVSTFAIASIVGRIVSGVALDRIPAHIVAAIGFGLPFIGLLLLASPFNTVAVVFFALALIGISFGGEGDVLPYLVNKYFGIAIFGTVLGLLTAFVGAAMAFGNVLIAYVLQQTDSFDIYLVTAAAGSLVGGLLFLLLGFRRFRSLGPTEEPAAVAA